MEGQSRFSKNVTEEIFLLSSIVGIVASAIAVFLFSDVGGIF